ncbi:hypothetical protein JYP46_01345 [Nitratireductor aquimarinus]|uniref:hypothetical protein n=1 Tax=Alphaproteobacteria TaxID=28211 RepID=UPI0019D3F1DA|nr:MULTISPECIES: hypothetical protein [Alphaproteobacteria]MBN7755455.1 hypothetical protein [Nitratireductor aquimarinus]MBY5998210.1 hypothetical protein [Tritonibacter mobilis]MBY6020237.1 hypothetical protein [Nitratireductor sp. DP7N14-4]
MRKINDGGLVFPGSRSEKVRDESFGGDPMAYEYVDHPGMSLRDYVAINVFAKKIEDVGTRADTSVVREIARSSLNAADIFIEAREQSRA